MSPLSVDERDMLRGSLRRLLTGTDPEKVAAALDEFGWPDLLAADPAEAVPALFETQGETVTTTPALSAVMAAPLLTPVPDSVRARRWTVVLSDPAASSEPGRGAYALTAGAPISWSLFVTGAAGEAVLWAVDATEVSRPVEGVDPWLGLVRLDAGAGGRAVVVARGDAVAAGWEAAVAAGRRALAHELCGLSRAMLALAVDHARERRQFGQAIGAFQAVKHRLADAKVAVTAAEAAADEAWADPGPLTALLAKLWAGRAARLTAKQAQQVLGGMGFTWEHPFHRHVRRALVLDTLLGSTTELQHELGRTLLATAELPRLAGL